MLKVFGKYGSIVSMVGIFAVGGLSALGFIDPATAVMIITALGGHAAVSDSAVKKAK